MATIHLHPTVLHSEASMAAFQRLHGLLIVPPAMGSIHALAIPALRLSAAAHTGSEAA